MEDLYERVREAVEAVSGRIPSRPRVGIVVGSGLGELEGMLEGPHSIPYTEIPHFPRSTAPGHEGNLLLGKIAGRDVCALQGRFHYYEGYSTKEVTFPIRVVAGMGVEVLLLTNAAGGLNPVFKAGDLMAVVDHIHLIPENPLRGLTDERLGKRFPDMSQAYDPQLIETAEAVAVERSISLRKGVYVSLAGPSLETPSETRMIRAAGADAVGLSTTPEVIVARSLDIRVLGLSVITNVNRPDCMAPILVDEILSASREAVPRLMRLVQGILARIHTQGA